MSLAGSLEEYLNDPNFEQNRIEYKTNKDMADKSLKEGKRSVKRTEPVKQGVDQTISALPYRT